MDDKNSAQIVFSTAGRDKGRCFYVLAEDGDRLLLVDGKHRPMERPKRKNKKHVQSVTRPDTEVARAFSAGGIVNNSELRKDLAVFRKSW